MPTSDDSSPESALPLSITIETNPINTPTEYNKHIYSIIHNLARCMHHDTKIVSGLCWRLYRQVSLQGFKRRGHYEIRLPHLVRVVTMDRENTRGELFFVSISDQDSDPDNETMVKCALALNPSKGLLTGLYECSLDLDLSNPWWRIESAEFDDDKLEWNIEKITRDIPTGHPKTCNATFTVNILRFTAPLPREESSRLGILYSWIQTQLEQARAEFNRTFKEK